jgi:hypothetical protein
MSRSSPNSYFDIHNNSKQPSPIYIRACVTCHCIEPYETGVISGRGNGILELIGGETRGVISGRRREQSGGFGLQIRLPTWERRIDWGRDQRWKRCMTSGPSLSFRLVNNCLLKIVFSDLRNKPGV